MCCQTEISFKQTDRSDRGVDEKVNEIEMIVVTPSK